ncbi:hypothetical protein [Sphingomonas jatrophae]|uniref:Uncharacterized protein n=1 Tax=Sphingomonas jatrophae TaxID=1166337 RepID=A0A1I6LMN6_9SPHN|nr:hypothetical protein [Sphingomonas jatrophae]SFS04683.1 hypothetical protein SAMN05192580_2977 [Sphingomonas jatrophae]
MPVSDAEHASLLADNERLLRGTERVMRWWLVVAVIAGAAWAIWTDDDPGRHPWAYGLLFVAPMPWVALTFRRADRLADELAGRRVAIAAPQGADRAALSRMAALPWSIGAMLVLVCALLAVQSRPWETTQQRLWLAEAVAGGGFGLWLLWLKRRR